MQLMSPVRSRSSLGLLLVLALLPGCREHRESASLALDMSSCFLDGGALSGSQAEQQGAVCRSALDLFTPERLAVCLAIQVGSTETGAEDRSCSFRWQTQSSELSDGSCQTLPELDPAGERVAMKPFFLDLEPEEECPELSVATPCSELAGCLFSLPLLEQLVVGSKEFTLAYSNEDGATPCEVACGGREIAVPDGSGRAPLCWDPGTPVVESCDQLDNDCDGSIDEGLADLAERCDALDQDCDGNIDEGFGLGEGCSVGEGLCAQEGQIVCSDTEEAALCNAVAGEPDSEERCDGFDNDCDAETDETFDLLSDLDHCGGCEQPCSHANATSLCSQGVCSLLQCNAGFHNANVELDDGCEYACEEGRDELCNLIDDDCDNRIDEGFELEGLDLGEACQAAGECGQGSVECSEDQLAAICSSAPGGSEDGSLAELCNQLDDDCDGTADEDWALDTSLEHCGACNSPCQHANATSSCEAGSCSMGACLPDFYDINLDPADGCEYACVPSNDGDEACDAADNDCDGLLDEGYGLGEPCDGVGECGAGAVECSADPAHTRCTTDVGGPDYGGREERCDTLDDDCDGETDEHFDLSSDVLHCGACGRDCDLANAEPACIGGECRLLACFDDWYNLNVVEDDGCEYQCVLEGAELCNERDNDCDGLVDEGFDKLGSLEHCGGCNRPCEHPRAVSQCRAGACHLQVCQPGWVDLDGDPDNGCEQICADPQAESCDRADNDCDGLVDEAGNGQALTRPCNTACGDGSETCVNGSYAGCDAPPVQNEICGDGVDQDCNGSDLRQPDPNEPNNSCATATSLGDGEPDNLIINATIDSVDDNEDWFRFEGVDTRNPFGTEEVKVDLNRSPPGVELQLTLYYEECDNVISNSQVCNGHPCIRWEEENGDDDGTYYIRVQRTNQGFSCQDSYELQVFGLR